MTEYSLHDLTKVADVSARTVRYYISEGLLPPPDVAGPRSSYSQAHLNRLLLIGRLKAAYLPLKEIRRRLNALSDADIDATLRQSADLDPPMLPAHGASEREDAAGYIAHVMQRSPIRQFRTRDSAHGPPASAFVDAPTGEPDFGIVGEPSASLLPLDAWQEDSDVATEGVGWRRISLGPDAELFVREDAYDRKRDRIQWLVSWAKRVFN